MLDPYAPQRQTTWSLRLLGLRFIAAMPWLMLLQALPRISAFLKYATGRWNRDWVKTSRTVEVEMEPEPSSAAETAA